MVVKPIEVVHKGPDGLAQPGIKVRGREYLRIIYGPEYTAERHLSRLRSRGLGRKRALAVREFALGIESLERFDANLVGLLERQDCQERFVDGVIRPRLLLLADAPER